jgi:hypothetical protein
MPAPSYKINTLIEKQDTNEIVRDQIAAIITVELARQRALAAAASKSQVPYTIDVYAERLRPWELLSDEDGDEASEMPLVNISFDNDTFDNKGSDTVGNQKAKGIFYIDCYGHKNSYINSKGVKIHGDSLTSRESDRVAALIRNIIMAGEWTYLGLQGSVFRRYILRREKFIPSDREGRFFETVVSTRMTLEVEYKEYSPQNPGVDLELLINTCEIEETGLVINQKFDYTE